MTGNPLSGHTKANESTMVGSGVFTDGLTDGEHIQSPTLTNYLEGLHGNGILLEEDTALGATARNTPEDLPGVCEQITNSYTVRVTGGTAVIDGVLYNFAGGTGSHQDVELSTTSAHRRATYSALTTGQEALVVVYVSTKTTTQCIQWELGTPITTATNAYPTTPSAFLIDPDTLTTLTSKQSVVLAVLRVVYSGTGGDLKISISESNDKRVFLKPSPMYLTPVTSGIVGNTTAIDSHTALDGIISGSTGNLAGSRMGALWQSYNADGDAILYYSSKDSGGTRHTHVLGPVGYVTSSPAATTTFTFNEGQVFVLNPSTAVQFNPSGTFPLGHLVYVTNEAAHGTNGITFDNAGLGTVILGKESGVFVYTGSAWKNVMYASGATSPNGHGASGNVQLSDGGGGFTSDNDLNWDSASNELTINGKLTVTGLIDPTGLELDPVGANPGGVAANTLWLDSGASNRPKIGTNAVMRASDNISELTNDSAFIDSAGAPVQSVNAATGAVVLDADDLADGASKVMMTTAERTKLTGIATGATAYADADAIAAVEGEATLDLTGAVTITNAGTGAPLTVISTDTGGGGLAPDVVLKRNTSVASEELGNIRFLGLDDGAAEQEYADMYAGINTNTAGNESGEIFLRTTHNGTLRRRLDITKNEVVINEDSIDSNFRVESNGNANMIFVDAGNDRVGIGTDSPDTELHIEGSSNPILKIQETGQNGYATYSSVADSQARIEAVNDTPSEGIIIDINPKCNASTGTSQEVRIFRESRSGTDGYFRIKQVGTNTDVFNVYSDKDGTAHTMTMDGTISQSVTNAVLVADGSGVISAASTLQDVAYVASGQAGADVYNAGLGVANWTPAPPLTIEEAIQRIAAVVAAQHGAIP